MTFNPLPLYYAGRTDTGRVRDHNEDAHGLPNEMGVSPAQMAAMGVLLAVADGMGGRAAGEEASRLGLRTLYDRYYADPQPDRHAALSTAIAAANAAVKAAGEADLSKAGMGSTLVALVCHNDQAFVAHAGDSRAYRLRGGKLEPLTGDHTWVAESVAAGVITKAEAANHPYRHSLTRALGLEATLTPTLSDWSPLAVGDRFLLCSDGLTNEIKEADIARWLAAGSPEQAASQLVARARAAGGRDNITAVVAAAGDGAGVALPAAAMGGAGRSKIPSWLLAVAGLMVGVLVIAAALIGRGNLGGKATPVPNDTPTHTPTPSVTPTPRAPTSTVEPTRTPIPTDTPTPTPLPHFAWQKLASAKIRLNKEAYQLFDEKSIGQLCQNYKISNPTCELNSDRLSIYLEGEIEKTEKLQEIEFIPKMTINPISDEKDWIFGSIGNNRSNIIGKKVGVLWNWNRKKPILIISAPAGKELPQCLYSDIDDLPCHDANQPTKLGWRAIVEEDATAEEHFRASLQAGRWQLFPSGISFVPEPDLTFRLNRRTGEYEPVASPQSP